jgi:CNT family concentrative nucleoside transporter
MIVFCVSTAWWIASLVLHHDDKNWVVPFLVWLAIQLRLLFWHVPSRYISNAIKFVWARSAVVVYDMIPSKFRTLAGASVAVAAILVGSFVSEESADNTRENRAVSLLGMAVFILILWLTSRDRKAINWRTVIGGMLTQYVIGLFVLRTGVGYDIFSFIAERAADLLGFARDGVAFLTNPDVAATTNFFFSVIPAIIFFISLVQVLYFIGFIQWFIIKFATFVFWGLGVSGAEAVVAAATPFIGQGESAMLVRPFVPHMTKAELHQIMTCGFATISGSTLVGYIGLGLNREALVSSCIMSIPASLAISKMRYPETEETLTAGRVVIPDDDEHKAENALHAFANGAWLGIKIAGTIITSLLCIIAFVAFINGILTWIGSYINLRGDYDLTLQLILGYLLFPVSFLLGVSRTNGDNPTGDILPVARLIAQKIITVSCNLDIQWSLTITDTLNRTNTTPSPTSPPPTPPPNTTASPLAPNSSLPMLSAVSVTSVLWVFRSVFSASLPPLVVVTLRVLPFLPSSPVSWPLSPPPVSLVSSSPTSCPTLLDLNDPWIDYDDMFVCAVRKRKEK